MTAILRDRETEVQRAEDAEVQKCAVSALQAHLPPDEQRQGDAADGERCDQGGRRHRGGGCGIRPASAVAASADLAETEDETAETESGQDHREHIDRCVRRLAEVVDPPRTHGEGEQRERQDDAEDPAPADGVEQQAGHARADRRCQ